MRGYRLQQANRIARKATNNLMYWWVKDVSLKQSRQAFGILRKTRTRCSCWMCANRRQYDGLTIQERRQVQ